MLKIEVAINTFFLDFKLIWHFMLRVVSIFSPAGNNNNHYDLRVG